MSLQCSIYVVHLGCQRCCETEKQADSGQLVQNKDLMWVYKDTKSAGHTPLVVNNCEVESSCMEDVEPL